MKQYGNGWPFGPGMGRTSLSGYRGDYTVYPDETWKMSLRKYPYSRGSVAVRRCRSTSPRRKAANTKNEARREALKEVMTKLDSTQEDLQHLARKVASWSREAASLSQGLKEEAMLLELSRQADRLAATEAQYIDLRKEERVHRLSRENTLLRDELRDMIRVCRVLLDRKHLDDAYLPAEDDLDLDRLSRQALSRSHGRARSDHVRAWRRAATAAPAPAPPAAPQTPAAASGYGPSAAAPAGRWADPVGHHRQVHFSSTPPQDGQARSGHARPQDSSSRPAPSSQDSPDSGSPVPYARAQEGRPGGRAARNTGAANSMQYYYAHGARRPTDRVVDQDPGVEGLTEENAGMVVAADSAQAEADADPRVTSAAEAAEQEAGYVREVAEQAARFKHEMDRDRQQVGAALAAVDQALAELTLRFPSGGGAAAASGRDVGSKTSSNHGTAHIRQPRTAGPSFAGFLSPDDRGGSTPVLRDGWQLQHHHQQQLQHHHQQQLRREAEADALRRQVQEELEREAEEEAQRRLRQIADEQQDAALAAAEAEAQAALDAADAADAAKIEAGGAVLRAEPVEGVTLGAPIKLAGGSPASGPPTPSYQGVSYGGGQYSAYPYIAAAGASAPAVPPTIRRNVVPIVGTAEPAGGGPYDPYSAGTVPRASAGIGDIEAAQPQPDGLPLDAILMCEVDKLKHINRTLASTLQSYNRVTNRLSGVGAAATTAPASYTAPSVRPTAVAAVTPAPAAMRALFSGPVAVAPEPVPPQGASYPYGAWLLTASTAATMGTSSVASSTTAHARAHGSKSALPVTSAVAAPAPPTPQLQRHQPQPAQQGEVVVEPSRPTEVSQTAHGKSRSRSPYQGSGYSDGYGGGGIGAGASGSVSALSEVQRLDSALDDQLYGIRRQLQALRHEMVEDRLAALAASAAGGTAAAAAAMDAAAGLPVGPSPQSAATAAAAATAAVGGSGGGEDTSLARILHEIAELRRQVEQDKRWYHDSLGSVVLERSAMFQDLQRRLDRLLATGV